MTASRGRLDHVVDAARNQFGPQADVEQILGYLRSEGLAIIDAIKTVMQLRGDDHDAAVALARFERHHDLEIICDRRTRWLEVDGELVVDVLPPRPTRAPFARRPPSSIAS